MDGWIEALGEGEEERREEEGERVHSREKGCTARRKEEEGGCCYVNTSYIKLKTRWRTTTNVTGPVTVL